MTDKAPKPANGIGSAPEVPVMTETQKQEILLLQRQSLTAQINLSQLQRQVDQSSTSMNDLLTKICKELAIDSNKYLFDLDKLTIAPKG
jgi:hypothetical protein